MKNWIPLIVLVTVGCAKLQPNAENQETTNSAATGVASETTVAIPVFSPSGGMYGVAQNVTISTSTAFSIICSAAGTSPACNMTKTGCLAGTLYTGLVVISTTQTLNAIACRPNYSDSTMASVGYTIDGTPPSVPTGFGGVSISTTQINLNWTASTDAITPQSNLVYEICRTTTNGGCNTFSVTDTSTAGAIAQSVTGLTANTAYYFVLRAKDALSNVSAGTSQIMVTTNSAGTASAPTFSPGAGTYGNAQNVSISSSTGGAIICHTTNGTTPACDGPKTGCTTGALYASAITVSSSLTIKAISCKSGFTDSSVNSAAYGIDSTPPADITGFTAVAGNTQITLSWTNPTDADLAGVKILRKTGSYPANSTDGTTIYNGTGSNFTDTDLTNGTQYYFKGFSYDMIGNNSAGTSVTSTPSNSGIPQWARTVSVGASASNFIGIFTDASNTYVVGSQYGTGTYTYGAGAYTTGTSAAENALLVKYDNNGSAQWARSISTGSQTGQFQAVAVDSSGNIFAVGFQSGSGIYTYGAGVTATAAYASGENAVLVKYDSSGTAQWARTISAGNNNSRFNGVVIDTSGNIFTAGYQMGNGSFTYGTGVTISGIITSAENAVLVKYNSSGTAQWARTVTAGALESVFQAIAIDLSGNIFTAGYQSGSGAYTYGAGISVAGISSVRNPVIVKYDGTGAAQWARSTTGGTNNQHLFYGVAVDTSGNVYAAGYQTGTANFTYGAGVSVAGISTNLNGQIVKYDNNGSAQWARSSTAGSGQTLFKGVRIDSSGFVYVAGYQDGTGSNGYGTGVSATGPYIGNNMLIIKYDSSGIAQWARTDTAGSNVTQLSNAAIDGSGNVYAAGYQGGTGQFTYGSGVTATGTYAGINAILLKYSP